MPIKGNEVLLRWPHGLVDKYIFLKHKIDYWLTQKSISFLHLLSIAISIIFTYSINFGHAFNHRSCKLYHSLIIKPSPRISRLCANVQNILSKNIEVCVSHVSFLYISRGMMIFVFSRHAFERETLEPNWFNFWRWLNNLFPLLNFVSNNFMLKSI